MKFIIQKKYLNEAIQDVSKAISGRTTTPILSGIKIEATTKGIKLTGSDTDITIQSFIPIEENNAVIVELFESGSVVLPAKILIEIIRKLPKEQIELETNSHVTTIRSGSSEMQLVGLDPEEYPQLPQIDQNKMFALGSDVLGEMIKQTVFAVSIKEDAPILTGILWKLTEDGLKMISCDRHRLASIETKLDLEDNELFNPTVVSGKTLLELHKILPKKNVQVEIMITENQALFRFNNTLFYSGILDGTYPDTSKLILDNFKTEFVVNSSVFKGAVERTYLLSKVEDKSNVVKLIMMENKIIEITSTSKEVGKVTETISIEKINGELMTISFNSKYMLQALDVMDSDFIRLSFTGVMSPIIIQPENDSNLLQLILPYRTTN